VVACLPAAWEVLGSNPCCGQVSVFSQKITGSSDTGYTLTAVSRSTQPSTLQRMVNKYQPYGWVIIHGNGWMFGLQQPTGRLDVKFAAWPTSWQPPGADKLSLRGPKVNCHIRLCAIDDSTINIILCIIIIIIIIKVTTKQLELHISSWHLPQRVAESAAAVIGTHLQLSQTCFLNILSRNESRNSTSHSSQTIWLSSSKAPARQKNNDTSSLQN